MMWKEEPITSSDNITEGKHVIKVNIGMLNVSSEIELLTGRSFNRL